MTTPHTAQPSWMARGRCSKCPKRKPGWIGERAQAPELNSSEMFGTEASMQRHRGLKQHLAKLAATVQPYVITSNVTMDLMDKFTVLPKSRSDAVWASRMCSVDAIKLA